MPLSGAFIDCELTALPGRRLRRPGADRRAEHHQAEDLEQHLRAGLGGVGGGVVLRRDLDHVAADDVERPSGRAGSPAPRAWSGRRSPACRCPARRRDRGCRYRRRDRSARRRRRARAVSITASMPMPVDLLGVDHRHAGLRRRTPRDIPPSRGCRSGSVRVGSSTPSSTAWRNGPP